MKYSKNEIITILEGRGISTEQITDADVQTSEFQYLYVLFGKDFYEEFNNNLKQDYINNVIAFGTYKNTLQRIANEVSARGVFQLQGRDAAPAGQEMIDKIKIECQNIINHNLMAYIEIVKYKKSKVAYPYTLAKIPEIQMDSVFCVHNVKRENHIV